LAAFKKEHWADLVYAQGMDAESIRKDTRQKYLGSIGVIILYSVFAFYMELISDLALMCMWLVNLSSSLILNHLAKGVNQLLNILEYSKYVAVSILPFALYLFPAPDSHRFTYMFTFLFFVFVQDFYKWQPTRFYSFTAYSVLISFGVTNDVQEQLTTSAALIFIAAVCRTTIITREENAKLGHMRNSFKVFKKHKNLMDHHILNNVTKLTYHKLMIDRSLADHDFDKVNEHNQSIQSELDDIEHTLLHKASENLHEFDLDTDMDKPKSGEKPS